MAETKFTEENHSSLELGEKSSKSSDSDPKKSSSGIVLVPQPSDDPQDPLNWPTQRKALVLATLCLAGFAGTSTPVAGQVALAPQAELYTKTLTEISYSLSAGLAGLAAGPFFITPLIHQFGRCSAILWSLVLCLVCNVWAACMTSPDQYTAFVMSRFFCGVFGAIPSVIGSQYLVDMFFIHQRGRVFSLFHFCFLIGPLVGPTLSGFVVVNTGSWENMFWWTVGLSGLALIMVAAFLKETGYDRESKVSLWPPQPSNFFANRVATFLPGNKILPRSNLSKMGQSFVTPFLITISPPTILIGCFLLVNFGLFIALWGVENVFLETPIEEGGYGFSLQKTIDFSFDSWVAVACAQLLGHFCNDRIPMMICARRGGVWKPEYRLHCLWFPVGVLLPLGFGLFGAALEYHLHYMVLALGSFFATTGAIACVPICVNYLVECFTQYAADCGIVMGLYRMAFGVTVTFFINPWIKDVGAGWTYGMMSFFTLASFGLIVILIMKGHAIRQIRFAGVASSEEGARIK